MIHLKTQLFPNRNGFYRLVQPQMSCVGEIRVVLKYVLFNIAALVGGTRKLNEVELFASDQGLNALAQHIFVNSFVITHHVTFHCL